MLLLLDDFVVFFLLWLLVGALSLAAFCFVDGICVEFVLRLLCCAGIVFIILFFESAVLCFIRTLLCNLNGCLLFIGLDD